MFTKLVANGMARYSRWSLKSRIVLTQICEVVECAICGEPKNQKQMDLKPV